MYTVKISTSINIAVFFFIFLDYTFAQEEFATTYNLPTSNDPLPNIPTISGTTYDAVDVKVFESSTRNQAEPTIAVNPVNGLNILAGAYTGDQGNKKLGYYYSLNGPTISPWLGLNDFPVSLTYSADPVAAFDADGAAYYCYLNGNKNLALDRIEYYTFLKKSTNGGATWDPPTQIPGSLLSDKPWLAIDQTNGPYKNRRYVVWSDFSNPFSNSKKVPIKFWSSTLPDSKIISDSGRISQRSQGVSIATGPNGEVYCVWAGYDTEMIGGKEVEIAAERRLVFNKSIDVGTTWATSKKIVDIDGIRGDWNHKSGDLTRLIRVNSFPSMAVDVGDGTYKGIISILIHRGKIA